MDPKFCLSHCSWWCLEVVCFFGFCFGCPFVIHVLCFLLRFLLWSILSDMEMSKEESECARLSCSSTSSSGGLGDKSWRFWCNGFLAGFNSDCRSSWRSQLPVYCKHSNWACCRGTPLSADCPTVHHDSYSLFVLWKWLQSWCCSHIRRSCVHLFMVIGSI
jgi:hypothetical protein